MGGRNGRGVDVAFAVLRSWSACAQDKSPKLNRCSRGIETTVSSLLSRWFRGQYDAERELARSGFFQSGFHVSLIGEPVALARSDDQVPIEQVTDTPSMEDYLEAYVGGWDRRIRSRPVQGQCHAVAEPSRMVALSWPRKWPTRCYRHPVCRGPHRLSRRCGAPSILPPTRLSLCAAMAPNP